MSTSKTKVPAIDLSGTVTADQYRAVLTALLTFAQSLANARGWCPTWTRYMRQVTPEFPTSGEGEINFDIPEKSLPREWFTDEGYASYIGDEPDYAERLRTYRGRILQHVVNGSITLSQANAAFTAAGLPTCEADPDYYSVLVYVPAVSFRVANRADAMADVLRPRLHAAYTEFYAAQGFSSPELANYPDSYPEFHANRVSGEIPAAQCSPLL